VDTSAGFLFLELTLQIHPTKGDSMTVALGRMKSWLAAACAAAVMVAAVALPASAEASTSNYCTGWQGGYGTCTGGGRYMYQAYGWGDQGAVCVAMANYTGWSCSSGAGAGVYSGQMFQNVVTGPMIHNNISGNNFVHGVALTH
jgi:opacity protein-like surface antigen